MANKYKILHTDYYEKFTCIGGACEDNCCKGWRIKIDKKTYMEYRKIRDPEFVEAFTHKVKRIKGDEASTAAYAEFVTEGEENICPFQMENGLCEIYAKQGPQYLCSTCQVYPRQLAQLVPKMAELSLSMSCPEAVRLGVLRDKPLTFALSEMEYEQNDKLFLGAEVVLPFNTTPDDAVTHAWNIREACIDILQHRGNSLAERLLIIGMMLKKADDLVRAGETVKISEVAVTYSKAACAGEFTGLLEKFERNEAMEQPMATIMHGYLVLLAQSDKDRYAPFINFFNDFMAAKETDEENLSMPLYRYTEDLAEKHWQKILDTYGQAIENSIVNYVFSTVFPFKYHDSIGIYHHFILLAEQYAMLRIALCHGEANGGLDEAKLTKVFTSLAYFAQHTQSSQNIVGLYRSQKADSLAHISFLLR